MIPKKKGSLTCTINSTGCTNINLGVSVDTSNPASVLVECTFEAGYTCTIVYGTDPSYTNLVYSDGSTTLGQVTTIALSQDLQRETTYYFIVSAESNSQCVRVWGRFRTGIHIVTCCFKPVDGFTINSQAFNIY